MPRIGLPEPASAGCSGARLDLVQAGEERDCFSPVVEASEPDYPMKAASLFGVLVVAHLLMLAGHPVQFSLWLPAAYFWQDLLIALLFGVADHVAGRPR